MADYIFPENPEYITAIRQLERTDPANAELFNALFQRLIENTHAVKLETDRKSNSSHTHLPGDCGLGKHLTLTGAATVTYNGQAAKSVLIPDRKGCRFVVGTSTAGHTLKDCDYLCDGTADQVEINNAINALPSTGGEIVILAGTYNITASIYIRKANTTLRGCGNSTILEKQWDHGAYIIGVIDIENNHVCVRSLQLKGNKDQYSHSYGIVSGGSPTTTNNKYITISEVTLKDFQYGFSCSFSESDIGIFDSVFLNCDYGVNIGGSGDNGHYNSLSIISNNRFLDCVVCGVRSAYGDQIVVSNNIFKNSISNGTGVDILSTNYIDVIGNIILNRITGIKVIGRGFNIHGNICKDCSYGISLASISESCIIGNICIDFLYIGINVSSSNRNLISENVCVRNNGDTGDYTSGQNTICVSGGSFNLISNNLISGKNYTNSGTGNTFVNNKYN